MKNSFDDKYAEDLKNPLNISKCQKKGIQKKIKGFFIKEILPKLSEIEGINSEMSYSWDELLDKLLNSKSEVDSEIIEVVMDIALQQKIIEECISNISDFSGNL